MSDLGWLDEVWWGVGKLRRYYPFKHSYNDEGYCFGPSLREEELAELEEAIGVSLPEDYRNFLKHVGNGGDGPGHGLARIALTYPERLRNRKRIFDCHNVVMVPNDQYGVPWSIDDLLDWEVLDDKYSRFKGIFPFTEAVYIENPSARNWPEYGGVIQISEIGCGAYYLLVINGEERGNIWGVDCEGLGPSGQSFREWYLHWLRERLEWFEEAFEQQDMNPILASAESSDLNWLKDAWQRVAELRRLNASYSDYRFRKTFSEEDVVRLEDVMGVRLPEDYRNFIKYVGNGGAGPGFGLLRILAEPSKFSGDEMSCEVVSEKPEIKTPFPLTEAFVENDFQGWTKLSGCTDLADLGSGVTSLLIVSGSKYGEVWERDSRGVRPAFSSFREWYLDWLQRELDQAQQTSVLQ